MGVIFLIVQMIQLRLREAVKSLAQGHIINGGSGIEH